MPFEHRSVSDLVFVRGSLLVRVLHFVHLSCKVSVTQRAVCYVPYHRASPFCEPYKKERERESKEKKGDNESKE